MLAERSGPGGTIGTMTERKIFFAALDIEDATARAAYLQDACGGDAALRRRMEDLLLEHLAGDSLLDNPAVEARRGVPATPPAEESLPRMIGRYKLLEKLGEGGFGEVWMAEQREPVKRRVALKVIKPGMDSKQVIARFEAERQALALMDHPNIAKILDGGMTGTSDQSSVGSDQSPGGGGHGGRRGPLITDHSSLTTGHGRPYFVMELVRGVKITEFCDTNRLSTEARLRLFIQVCQAVHHAHQKGIIHRDLKPSNVMVTLHDGVPVPKVIDFGIAKATQGELTDKTVFTQFQQFIGTPAYISPEQAEMSGLDVDTRSDIYSLGVLLYELLVGQTPFDAREMMQGGLDALRRIIREKEPVRPSTKLSQTLVAAEATRRTAGDVEASASSRRRLQEQVGQLRGDLDWIVMKCLEKDRARRYDSATGLAADLQRLLSHEPVLARPPSAAYQLQKAWRRNKLAFTAAAAVAAALLVGISVSTWQAVRATRAEREQSRLREQAETAQRQAQDKQQEAEQQRKRAELSEAKTSTLLYRANLNLAQASFEQSNIPQTRRLLEETRSHADRGFEWYYWQRELHRPTRILRGHAGIVERVAFSPDGRRLLTQGQDDVVIIRDAASGKEQFREKLGTFLQFAPDGERLLCSLNDRGVQIRSASTGAGLTSTDLVWLGAFTPDGKRFATVRGERAVFRDAITGQELSSFKAFSHFVEWFRQNPISFSPDGRWMLAAKSGLHEGVALHDAVTGEIEKIFAKGDHVHAGVFSPDGRRIVTWDLFGGEPAIWDISQPDRPLARLSGLNGARAVTFSPDGRRLLTGGQDQRATLWDAETFKVLGRFEGHTGEIRDVAFSPDNQWVATASADGTARIWAAHAFAGPRVLEGPGIGVGAFSPDGRYLATGRDGVAAIWETATGKPLRRLQVYHPLPGKVRQPSEDDVDSVSFSPDGRRLVASGKNFIAIVFDVESGQTLWTLDHASTNLVDREVVSAVFSPDGKQIVTMNNLKVMTWDAASGRPLRTKVYQKTNELHLIPPVGFTPDGRLYCASNEEVTLWDPATDEEVFHLPVENAKMHNPHHPTIAFSPDGKRFALHCLNWKGDIQVREVASGRLLHTLKGHRDYVPSLEFSPDGKRLLSGSHDTTAKIWDLGSGRELLSFKAPQSVTTARFAPDGRTIFAGGHFTSGFLLEAATPEQVTAWEAEDAKGTSEWTAMTKEFYEKQKAGWVADGEAGKARRAAFMRASEEKLARLVGPAPLATLPGSIRQWLALSAPPSNQPSEIQLDDEQIQNEARLRPRAQEKICVHDTDRVWTPLRLEDYRLDFRTDIKSQSGATVAYAVSYIFSERAHTGLVLKVGSDYHAKIYLNQREIHRRVNPPTAEPDRDTVTGVELKAGLNVLVFKVVKESRSDDWPWGGSVRFTTADGGPVHGLTVTLDPDVAP